MKRGLLGAALMVVTLVATAAAASKATPKPPLTGAELENGVRHEILMYSNYTLWDDINFHIQNGNVELLGSVSQPYKRVDLERIVQRIPGVASVTNELKVQPLSSMDDRLRLQVARAIFRDPVLSRYAMGAVPSIHIIVNNGHVTLTGAVMNNMDKQIAGMRASGAGLSFGPVVNNLTVDHPPAKKG
jgi:hyperosmotically inducible protein